MSGKNRAFALAVATAALVGLSAPVASAASFSGPSGFNGDSVLNVSGNQVPVQACNDFIPVNAAGIQVPLQNISAALGLLSSGNQTSSTTNSCTQNPTETNSQSITTSSTSTDPTGGNTFGFNGDSIVKVTGNQIPVQACNDTVPVNVLGGQVVGQDIAGALGILTTGTTSATTSNTCTNNPTETNGSTISSTN
jgi:hypothetical protein